MKRSVFLFFALVFTFVLFTTCRGGGLGESVDVKTPSLSILTPVTNSAHGSDVITFTGSYSDDKDVKSVKISLYKKGATEALEGYSKSITKDESALGYVSQSSKVDNSVSGTWTYNLDASALTDGSYILKAVANDGTHDSSEVEKIFDVDKTAPVFLLNKPSSTNILDPYSCGTSVSIGGYIADDHEVSLAEVQVFAYDEATKTPCTQPMEFELYDSDGNKESVNSLTFKNVNTAGDVSLTLAKFDQNVETFESENPGEPYTDNLEKQRLHDIYKTIYNNSTEDTVRFYLYIQLTDIAGNVSDCTWLCSDLKSALSISNDTGISDIVKKVLNGVFEDDSRQAAINSFKTGLAEKTKDADGKEIALDFADRKLYGVSISNKVNPTYSFSDYNISNEMAWQSVKLENDLSMSVTVQSGKDGYGVEPKTLRILFYKVVENNSGLYIKTSTTASASIEANEIFDGSTPASSIDKTETFKTFNFTLPAGSLSDGYYVFEAEGWDSEKYELLGDATYGFKIQKDIVPPSIEAIALLTGASESGLSEEDSSIAIPVVGGTKKRWIQFKVSAKSNAQEDGVEKPLDMISANVDGKDYALTKVGDSYYYSEVIDISSVVSNDYTLKITASASGVTSEGTKTVRVSNDGPEVEFASPAKGDETVHTSEVIIQGSAWSQMATEISGVQFRVVDNDTIDNYKKLSSGDAETVAKAKAALIDAVEEMNDLLDETDKEAHTNSGTNTNWKFKFTPFEIAEASSSDNNFSQLDHDEEGVYTLPIMFLATDVLGNKTLVGDYAIIYDPYADRPTTEILSLATGKILSGRIRVSGSAIDNEKVQEVYLQIDVNRDGKFTSEDAKILAGLTETSESGIANLYTIVTKQDIADNGVSADFSADTDFWGIKVNSTQSWYYTINTSSELQSIASALNTETGKAELSLRAAAFDNNYILGRWSDVINFEIDPNAPTIDIDGVISADDYSVADDISAIKAKAKDYTDSMSLRGKWYVIADIYDESGVPENSLYYKRAATYDALDEAGEEKDFVYKGACSRSDGQSGYTVLIPLDTDSGEGTKYVRFGGTDNGEAKIESKSEWIFRYDNNAPRQVKRSGDDVLFDTSDKGLGKQKLKVSNKVLSFRGYVEDSGTGFERAMVYFTREIGGAKTIELPLPQYDSTDSQGDLYLASTAARAVYTVSENEIAALATGASAGKEVYKNESTGLYGISLKTTSANRKETTFTHSLVDDYPFIRKGGLAYIGGAYHKIENVEGTTVTFEDTVSVTYTQVFFPMLLVVDNTSYEASYSDSQGYYHINGDDGDGICENISSTSTIMWKWQVDLLAQELDDGPVTIDVMVMDKAGNASEVESTSVMLANHAPRISKVYLAGDIDESKNFTDKELVENASLSTSKEKVYYFPVVNSSDSAENDVLTLCSTGAKMIGDFALAIEMLGDQTFAGYGGGNGKLYYKAGIRSDPISAPEVSADMSEFESSNRFSTSGTYTAALKDLNKVYFSGADYKSLTDGSYYINLSIADSTNGIALGTAESSSTKNGVKYYDTYGTQAFAVNIPIVVDLEDKQVPMSVIDDFYWAGAENNSLYENSKKNGHIELPGDLPAAFNGTTGLMDKDPKVSGQISLRGHVYDDQRLESIWVAVSNWAGLTDGYLTSSSITEDNGKDGIYTAAGLKYYQLASYSISDSKWTVASSTLEGNGLAFSVDEGDSNSYFSQAGHKIKWQLDFDTSKINNLAQTDVNVKVLVRDHSGNFSSLTDVKTGDNILDSAKNRPYYQMDVVPYVTGFETKAGSRNSRDNSIYGRSALGVYPLYFYKNDKAGSSYGESVTVSGFNLAGAKVNLQGSAKKTDAEPEPTLDDGVFTLPSWAKSGKVTFTVNGIECLNNINSNDAAGSYAIVNTDVGGDYEVLENYYNRQPNGTNNNLLTDDLEIVIWELDAQAVKAYSNGSIAYPVMRVNPKTGMLGFGFVNSASRFSLPNTSGSASTDTSYSYWGSDWYIYKSTEFVFGDDGYMYGVAAGCDNASTSNLAASFRFHTSNWGVSHGGSLSTTNNEHAAYGNYNAVRLDTMGVWDESGNFLATPDRIKSPSMAVTNPDDNTTNVYLAYYDDATKELRFRSGEMTSAVGERASAGSRTLNSTGSEFGQFVDLTYNGNKADTIYENGSRTYAYKPYTSNGAHNVSLIASEISGANGNSDAKTGEYIAISVVPKAGSNNTDVVVAVWYDDSSKKLWYSYLTSPLSTSGINSTTMLNSNWSTPVEILSGNAGGFCDIAVDAAKGIHIAAYSTSNGGCLMYSYLSSYSATPSTCLVDSYGITGQYMTIDTAKVDGKYIPYITYYHISSGKAKYAYLVDTSSTAPAGALSGGLFTGKWEVMFLPTNSNLERSDLTSIGLGIYKDSSGAMKNFPTGTNAYSETFTNSWDNNLQGNVCTSNVEGKTYANGTSNPVVSYPVKYGAGNTMETAQMR